MNVACFSHLGWDWVWQRPQHVLSRIARRHAVLYFNEPKRGRPDIPAQLLPVAEGDNLAAYDAVFPDEPGVVEAVEPLYAEVIRVRLKEKGWLGAGRPLVGWFYTPMPLHVADVLPLDLIVYDMMDDLANFKGAPEALPEREARLLARADLVFAGSPALYEAKKHLHPDIHPLPSGVEPADFRPAGGTHTPAELRDSPRPVVGFYGVLDERLDVELLGRVAELRPDWSWVLVGPVLKIDEASLPRRPNIIYTGLKRYDELPAYLNAFDVAMIPFAMNKATLYLMPTKTLEYMAAHKPIVSTPLGDVARGYGSVVRVAATPEQFVGQVEAALGEGEAARAARVRREEELLAAHSWDAIVARMLGLVEERLARKRAGGRR
jgi:UDP-galactopyranose mutase